MKIYGQKTLFHRTGEQFLIRSNYLYLTQVQQKSLVAYFHLWMSMKLMILISEAEQVSHRAKMGPPQGLLNSIAMDLHYHNLANWCIGLIQANQDRFTWQIETKENVYQPKQT